VHRTLTFFLLASIALCASAPTAQAQGYVEREIRIPWTQAAPNGLDALLVYVDLPGKHPLLVLTHGSARNKQDHALVSPWQQLPQALWFAQRGWVVLAVVRRGFGSSGGEEEVTRGGRCPKTDYEAVDAYAADSLRTAIEFSRSLPEVDDTRIVAAGVSTGGMTSVALTANPPRGLVAGINFAGGRGSKADHDVCNPVNLVSTYKAHGKKSRIPMLWIYSENDKFFWPELAQKFDAAFKAAGGQDEFVLAPPDGDDGHHLFSHIEAWSDTVDAFLKQQNLAPRATLLPEPQAPNVPPPAGLGATGLLAFHRYLIYGPHKAFAVSGAAFGYSNGRITADEARQKAYESCEHSAQVKGSCKVVSVDGSAPQVH
jgi:dienelactone hydrolase